MSASLIGPTANMLRRKRAPLMAEHSSWWVISDEAFAEALRRVADGDDPWIVATEFYANSDVERTEPRPLADRVDAEYVAISFHRNYEDLAPEFGYRTRVESAVPWADVPEANRLLMIQTCRHVLRDIQDVLDREGAPAPCPDCGRCSADCRCGDDFGRP